MNETRIESAGAERIDDFGVMPDGTPVPRYRLAIRRGLSMEVIALGGIVTQLNVPDRDGVAANVLLSPWNVGQILGKSQYLGALIGRVANRIDGAAFTLDGRPYRLAANDDTTSLHGGAVGYDKRLWTITPAVGGDWPSVRLTLTDPADAEGYPGTVHVTVDYTLVGDSWRIDYAATADAPTPLGLTQHAYFNLRDAGRSTILDHVVRLRAGRYTPVGPALVPLGEIAAVDGTPFDYRDGKPVGRDFDRLANTPLGVDHNFIIDGPADGTLRPVADATDPVSGRHMTVFTTEPAVQFYTGNFLDGTVAGPDGFAFGQHTGFCLETQHYPNAVNVPEYPGIVLRPGQTFRSTTEYRFDGRRYF